MKDSNLSIPIHLPAPRLGTFTTATRRRYCGFLAALSALIVHGSLVLLRGYQCVHDWKRLGMMGASCLATAIFFYLLKTPKFCLKERNLKGSVVMLIPVAYFLTEPPQNPHSLLFFFAHSLHLGLCSIYAYALGMNGRSSSILACLKPYRFQMIPVILHVPSSAYDVPVRSISIVEEREKGLE